MQNSSNNNIQSWKQRLDDFEDIPGNNLDRNEAWNKLQQKKQATKNPRKTIGYWLAAACAAGLAVFVVDKMHQQPESNVPPAIVKTKNEGGQKESTAVLIKNTPVITENVKENILVKKDGYLPEKRVVIASNDRIEESLFTTRQEEPEQMITIVDTIARPSIPAVVKNKKLKVVHLNELNQRDNSNSVAQQEGKPYFPITYQTKQVYTNAADNNTKPGKDNLIRIKLFP